MEGEIVELKQQLDNAVKDDDLDTVLALLKAISLLDISKDLLQKTAIGKSVGLLRKNKNEAISKNALELVDKWKEQLATKTTPASSTPPIKKESTTTTTTSSSSVKKEKDLKEKEKESSPPQSSSLTPSLKRKLDIKDEKKENEDGSSASTTAAKPYSPISVKKQQSSRSTSYSTELPYLSDDTRAKTMKLIADSLEDKSGVETLMHHNQAAAAIESEMYNIFNGPTTEYRTKARSIIFNLKQNKALRDSILSAEISITRFCSMDSNEMANKELQEERKKMLKFSKEAATLSRDAATTDQFQCGKCKQRKCTYFQLQTRSADEPLTTFVTCVNCNNRWKFC